MSDFFVHESSYVDPGVTIGENVVIDKAIIAEDTVIGDGAILGVGEEKPNKLKESVYAFGLVTIGECQYCRQRPHRRRRQGAEQRFHL